METVEFSRTREDLLAFSMFLNERTGQLRRTKVWGAVAALLMLGGYGYWKYFQAEDFASGVVSGVVFAVLAVAYAAFWYFWAGPRQQRWCIRRAVNRMYGNAADTSHKPTLTDDGVKEVGSEGETFQRWGGIADVARTDDHLFLFVGPASAHIVPVSAFPSKGDAEAFFSIAQARRAQVGARARET